ncbi:hypothetical protein MUP05_01670, partial [Candidatus Bathyarchaeota archaeon]|nr:hypothetical protein [Candidatus Bathyarchaeota archaeon]
MPPLRTTLITATVLLLVVLFSRSDISPAAGALPPVIDTDNPAYSHLQNRILISGSGFQSSLTYYVWLKKPGEGNTSYTGVSFLATTTGGIPYPDVSVSLGVQPILGSYLLSASVSSKSDTGEASCHFGVVGTAKLVYQRREVMRFAGGGVFPGSTVRVDMKNALGVLVRNATMIANELGEFEHSWSIPNNAQVGSWTSVIGGTGTLDNSLERYHAEGQFGVIEASLKMTIHQQPLERYQRTQTAKVALIVKYPDGSPVTTIKQGSKPVDIYRAGIRTSSIPMVLSDQTNGVWVAEYSIPMNETLGRNVTLSVSKESFDDGFGNRAPSSPYISPQFEIVQAQLGVSISSPKTAYQVLFESVTLNVTVKYPGGMDLVDGRVSVAFEMGTWRNQKPLMWSEKSRSWILTYDLTISEIQHVGTWKVTVLAEDDYANRGVSSIAVDVGVLWFLVTALALTVLAVVIVKWVREET